MNKAFVFFIVSIGLSLGVAFASEEPNNKPYVSAQRSLSVNRSLLARTEAEYRDLSREQIEKPSTEMERNLDKLQYKIKALREDAQRLMSELPKNIRAAEFLKDLLGHAPLDLNREKKLNEKLKSVYTLHEKALELVSQKRYEEASKTYEKIILESPDDDEAYLLMGHTCLLSGQYEKAKRAFLNAIHIDPSNQREIPRLYENTLLENPRDDAAYSHLGFAYWALDQKERAVDAFQSALEINSDNLEAKTALESISKQSS